MSTKKEDLLVAAEQLFYQHGFHAIGLKAIVQEADVALMTLLLEIRYRGSRWVHSLVDDPHPGVAAPPVEEPVTVLEA